MPFSIPFSRSSAWAIALACAPLLPGCSSVDNLLQGDKVDYRSAAVRTPQLEVPPDLTQLAREGRYTPQPGGAVSAVSYGQATAAAQTGPASGSATVAPQAVGDVRVERSGTQRWLVTPMSPEQLWPLLTNFWTDLGFTLAVDAPDTGVLETAWAENRAKLPSDIVRNTVGRIFDSFYSTGERDLYRTRVERTAAGTEIYISHRGMEEVYTNEKKDSTVWQPRPVDPQLEAEFLSRLMVKLGAKPEAARVAVASAPDQPARARVVSGAPTASLQVDEAIDRAWRRVGLALDRTGFTVEDRDRSGGLYYVRYVDPNPTQAESKGLFARLFGPSKEAGGAPVRVRIALRSDGGERTLVAVQNAQGGPDTGATAQRIVSLLVDDLK